MAAVERTRKAVSPAPGTDPHISIVIPIYNEQAILHAAVVDVRERLKPLGWSYEIILAENGSKDRTVEIGQELAAHGVHSVGRYGGWTYCSIEDNMLETRALAERL